MIRKLQRWPSGKHVVVLSGLLTILMASFIYLIYLNSSSHLLPDKDVKQRYLQTNCQVVSKKLSGKRFVVQQYRADFLVSYTVKHIQFRRWVSGNGLDDAYVGDAPAQEDILSRYHVGGDYHCYYNPEDPEMVVLVLRHDWGSMFPVIAVSAIILLTLYYFLKRLFILTRSAASQAKKRLAQRKNRIKKG